jgi:hypothetical protein
MKLHSVLSHFTVPYFQIRLNLGLSPWEDVSGWGCFKYEVWSEADQLTYLPGYGHDDPVIRVQFQTGDRRLWGSPNLFPSKYWGLYSEGTMHLDAEYPHPNFLHVKNTWSYDSTPPFVVMTSSLIKHRNKSTLSTEKERSYRNFEKTTKFWENYKISWVFCGYHIECFVWSLKSQSYKIFKTLKLSHLQ